MHDVIHIRDAGKSYGSKRAVNRLNLSIPQGAIFALLGDNGAGKTTTIRMLTGLLQPDHGTLTVLGKDCWKDALYLRRQIGYVPEKPQFYDWMSIDELGWFTAGFHANGFHDSYSNYISHFQLSPENNLQNLSKGQYAKVGLSLALAFHPPVLILDEPTSGLDLLVRREFLTNMLELADEGRTILISSHQVAEIERIASHVAFMSHGEVLLSGSMEEIRARAVQVSVHFRDQPPEAHLLGRVLEEHSAEHSWRAIVLDPHREEIERLKHREDLSEVVESRISLEEVYCALLAKEGRLR